MVKLRRRMRTTMAGLALGIGTVLAGTAAAATGAPGASADQPVTATASAGAHGSPLRLTSGRVIGTVEFGLELSTAERLTAYCVELHIPFDARRQLIETPWAQFPDPASPAVDHEDEIAQALALGYPATSLATLRAIDAPWAAALTEAQAIAGTQLAVWYLSDAAEVTNITDAAVIQLAGHLRAAAVAAAATARAGRPTASVSPASATGQAGERLGPFQLSTDHAASSTVVRELPSTVRLVDAGGDEPTDGELAAGVPFWFDIPAAAPAGSASVVLTAVGSPEPATRLFTPEQSTPAAQALVAPGTRTPGATVDAVASWRAQDVAPGFTTPPGATAVAGGPFEHRVEASGSPRPTFSAGALPPGLTFDAESGVLRGTAPDAAGEYPVEVTAANGVGTAAVQRFVLRVAPGPAATVAATPSATSVPVRGSVDLAVDARDAFGNPIPDAASRAVVTSDHARDVIDGTRVTFPSASPHVLTVSVDGVSTTVRIEVIPDAAPPAPPTVLAETGVDVASTAVAAALALALSLVGLLGVRLAARRRRVDG